MKPLDLSKPVQTRDGYPARIVSTSLRGRYSICAAISYGDGTEYLQTFKPCGARFDQDTPHSGDLVNVSERKTATFWVNLYPDSATIAHDSAAMASIRKSKSGTTVKVTVDYVEGVDQL